MDAYTASDMDICAVDPAALVDIRDVKVNTALPKRERILDFIRQIGNPYCYRHGKYVVRVSFTDTDISLYSELLQCHYDRYSFTKERICGVTGSGYDQQTIESYVGL